MITWDDFDKIWASTSPLIPYSFSDPNYAQGWNFVGNTPPTRQMWDSIQKQNDEKFKYLRDNFGTPNIVTQASQMTDTDKVYVYMGSEAGWNSGHWYYYNEGTSSWEDGGVYNSVAFVTDPTLSIAGKPADAKATGDALALKADLAGCTFTGNVNVNADFSTTGDVSVGGDINATGDVSADNLTTSADATIGGNLSVTGTTALAGTSTAPTPSADDNSTNIATTEYVQTEIKPIETDVDIAEKDIANIKALLQGNLYDYQTDSSSAYTKTVPNGAMPYAGLEKVGGKTVVMNQLYGNLDTSYGVIAKVQDGKYTLNGTASKTLYPYGVGYRSIVGHKYYVSIKGNLSSGGVSASTLNVKATIGRSKSFASAIGVQRDDTFVYIIINEGTYSNTTITCRCYDLTLMFGAGNEPSTTAEVEAMFPAETYPFSTGTLLSAGVTSVVSKDSNNATLQTYSIPASIQALEGYGWSAGTAYNYVDFERKVFVKNVGSRAYASDDESDSTVITDGTTTYYPLNPAIETDISEYLTDDNLIQVGSGGTLTFPNSNGTDYQIPVPSAETYMINLQEAVSNG